MIITHVVLLRFLSWYVSWPCSEFPWVVFGRDSADYLIDLRIYCPSNVSICGFCLSYHMIKPESVQNQYEQVLLNIYVKQDREVVSYLTPLTGYVSCVSSISYM